MSDCPKCIELGVQPPRKLKENMVANCLSRRDNETYICSICGMIEAMADEFGISEQECLDKGKIE